MMKNICLLLGWMIVWACLPSIADPKTAELLADYVAKGTALSIGLFLFCCLSLVPTVGDPPPMKFDDIEPNLFGAVILLAGSATFTCLIMGLYGPINV